MSVYQLIDIAQRALETMVVTAMPFLLAAVVVGIVIGLFQAITQLQDQALSFVPKLLALVVVLFFTGSWVLNGIGKLMRDIFMQLAEVR